MYMYIEIYKVHPHRHNHHRRNLLGQELAKRTTSATSQRGGSIKAISRPGSATAEPQQDGEEEGVVAQKEIPPVPETTIFMLAVEFLLEVKGMQVG